MTKRLLAGLLILTACGGGTGSVVGKWESTFGGVGLDFQAGNKVLITVVGMTNEGTWDVKGDTIFVHGPASTMALTKNEQGDLEDGMAGRFVRQKN